MLPHASPPTIVPFFPLPMVLFPGEVLPLHIFEPRYRQLVAECLGSESTFCIPTLLGRQVQRFGAEVRILEVVNRYPDGRLDIRVQGEGVFDCLDFYPEIIGKLYPGGPVRRLEIDRDGDLLQWERLEEAVRLLWYLSGVEKEIPVAAASGRTFTIGHYVGLDLAQEYELLSLTSEREREAFLIQHLQTILPAAKAMDAMRQKARMNGHFREFPPQEWDRRP